MRVYPYSVCVHKQIDSAYVQIVNASVCPGDAERPESLDKSMLILQEIKAELIRQLDQGLIAASRREWLLGTLTFHSARRGKAGGTRATGHPGSRSGYPEHQGPYSTGNLSLSKRHL